MRSLVRVRRPGRSPRLLALVCLLLQPILISSLAAAATRESAAPRIVAGGSTNLVSSGSYAAGSAKATTDSLYVYGGPDTLEGKFETATGLPDKGGWVGVDRTDIPAYWHLSEFNASTLNNNGLGNQGVWCGRSAAQEPGWAAAPGYGNSWMDYLVFEKVVSDPQAGQVVSLDFFFHHDVEANYDHFTVEYDSAGTWVPVYSVDGTNKDASGNFAAPGIQFASLSGVRPIVYAGGDYGYGSNWVESIHIRLGVQSDVAWSDEDGLFDSDGAVQVDDITVTCSEGTFFDDFETGFENWMPDKKPFAGDFFDVYPLFLDIDPCVSDATPVAAFVDAGQVVGNSASAAQIPGYPTSTGGQTSPTWSYGVSGSWVVNFSGGLDPSLLGVENEMHSPVIEWDLPGAEDDAIEFAGSLFRFDVWSHLPRVNEIFRTWGIRSRTEGGSWGSWRNRGLIYYSPNQGRWKNESIDVTNLIVTDAAQVQLRLGVIDLGDLFDPPGFDATPSPVYDNISLQKYRLSGPVISTRPEYLAQDGFPVSGEIDISNLAALDALDIPFDMARDVSTGNQIVPGDSLVFDIESLIPGASVTDTRMFWVLQREISFDEVPRTAPNRAQDVNVEASNQWRWSGEVLGQQVHTPGGWPVADRYYFDLPDVDFFYPGDRLRYYIRATDSEGRVSTMPEDVSRFDDGRGYDRTFEIYGLPRLNLFGPLQPEALVIREGVPEAGESDVVEVLPRLGYDEGLEFDVYTVRAPSENLSNGIGSAGGHGATLEQLAGYETILYLTRDQSQFLLSDGSDAGRNDKGDDLGLLTAWHDLPGRRSMGHFGDGLVSGLSSGSAAGAAYVQTVLGVQLVDEDVSDEIGGQRAPLVVPLNPFFESEFVAFGDCPSLRTFDSIAPLAPAFRAHGFSVSGDPSMLYSAAASVIHDRESGTGDRKIDITLPYGYGALQHSGDPPPLGLESPEVFLFRVFDYLGFVPPAHIAVPLPERSQAGLSVHPNPFNPRTVIQLSVPSTGEGRVEIFDLRGRRIRVLHAGPLTSAAEHTWTWNGRDDAGDSVASGVYVIRATGENLDLRKKAVLLK